MSILFIIVIILLVIFFSIIGYLIFRKKKPCSCCSKRKRRYTKSGYKGVVLFDIDGTLTTGENNYQTVKNALDRGYAVGVCTAGAMYNPSNIQNFSWMPKNLLKFMQNSNFITFNNVASGILNGKNGLEIYQKEMKKKPSNIFWPGWLKAVAMKSTADMYNTDNVILLDNDGSFIEGVKAYDNNLKVICAGKPCGPKMTPKLTSNI